MNTITILYNTITLQDLTDAAAQSILPIVAIGAGGLLVGWGAFAVVSKLLSIIAERNARPHQD